MRSRSRIPSLLIVTLAACSGERTQSRAPGQPTMNELMHRSAAKSRAQQRQGQKLVAEARALTPEQAGALEAALRAKPDDIAVRERLVRYYGVKQDWRNRDRHGLWAIQHTPKSPMVFPVDPALNPSAFAAGKRLWLAQLDKGDADTYVAAARFIAAGDKRLAEKILLEAKQKFPARATAWNQVLGRLYYEILMGSQGPLPLGVIRSVSFADGHGEHATEVRRKLEASINAELLVATGHMLVSWGTPLYDRKAIDFDPYELGKRYVDRAVMLAPDSPRVRAEAARLSRLDERRWLRQYRGRPLEQLLPIASEQERWQLYPILMYGALHKDDRSAAANYARAYLALASRDVKNPRYDWAVFDANMMLGKVALRSGDRRTARRHLLAAAETAGSAHLLFGSIDMSLARSLVDWGEREAVAQFLERCACFSNIPKTYTQWAAQIRNGINPDLIPYMSGCAKEPC